MPLPVFEEAATEVCSGLLLDDISSYSCTNMVGINPRAGYWLRVGTVRAPDFYQLTVNVGFLVGWTFSFSVDRYGHLYFAPIGLNVGKSATRLSFSLTPGWMQGWNQVPSPSAIEDFLTSWGCSAGGGYWGGLLFGWSSDGQAWMPGTVSPQVGISCGYGFKLR